MTRRTMAIEILVPAQIHVELPEGLGESPEELQAFGREFLKQWREKHAGSEDEPAGFIPNFSDYRGPTIQECFDEEPRADGTYRTFASGIDIGVQSMDSTEQNNG